MASASRSEERAARRFSAGAGHRLGAWLLALPALVSALTAEPPGKVTELPAWRSLHALDGEGRRWGAEELAGKIVLLDFWATWCAPCLAELPHLKRSYTRFRDDGFVIVGVAMDRRPRRDVLRFVRRHQLAWPQIHDGQGFDGKLARALGVEAVPRSVLLDRRGRIVATDLNGNALHAVLSAMLLAGPGTGPDALAE